MLGIHLKRNEKKNSLISIKSNLKLTINQQETMYFDDKYLASNIIVTINVLHEIFSNTSDQRKTIVERK